MVKDNMLMTPPFLGIDRSFKGNRWVRPVYNEDVVESIKRQIDVEDEILRDILAKILMARNVNAKTVSSYLNPSIADSMPDPSTMIDVDKAAVRIAAAIMKGEKIAIFGDYDVDGATSSAFWFRFFSEFGIKPIIYIPDRHREGYGPNPDAMRKLARQGMTLTICVDCGSLAFEAMEAAKQAGMDVVINDHHSVGEKLPSAYAVVNPNREDDVSGLGYLTAIGVSFMQAVAVNREVRRLDPARALKSEKILEWLDLVALGTICDVAKLVGFNRVLVYRGLKRMGLGLNLGIRTIAQLAGKQSCKTTYDAGFVIGPRINAGGRIGDSWIGAHLLASDDLAKVVEWAEKLQLLNRERGEMEKKILEEVAQIIFPDDVPLIFLAREGWHKGLVGLVAGRLAEIHKRPAIVIGMEGGVGSGSGRSRGDIDLGAAVRAAVDNGLLMKGGGHPKAAGLTVVADKLEALQDFLTESVAAQTSSTPSVPELVIDGALGAATFGLPLADALEKAGPYGEGNPEPVLVLPHCQIVAPRTLDNGHVSFTAVEGGVYIRAFAPRAMDSELGPQILESYKLRRPCHLAGYVRSSEFSGKRKVEFHITDGAVALG